MGLEAAMMRSSSPEQFSMVPTNELPTASRPAETAPCRFSGALM
jgi:hypothetical protein